MNAETQPVNAAQPHPLALLAKPSPTVFEAVARAAKACKIAGLDARNDFDRYDYRSIRGVMDAAHEALASNGVTVALHEMRDLKRELVATKKDGTEVLVTYTGVFRVYGPTGDYFDVVNYCEGLDRRDKAGNKASSAGYKEVLQKILTLPFGHDEVEEDGEDQGTVQRPQSKPKGQQKAIDNKKPAAPMPWDGVADFAVKYESDFHVYLKVENGAIVQGDVRELLTPVLTELEVGLPKRQKYFADKNMTPMAECCNRDLKVVCGELTRRADAHSTGSGQARDKKTEAPGTSPAGAEDGGGTSPADGTSAPSAEPGVPATAPVSSFTVATRAANLAVELTEDLAKSLQLTTGLSDDELALVRLLSFSEVLAIAQHPANTALFDAALAPVIEGFNELGDIPLSPAWLAGAWAKAHNMNKERRMPARKLLRLAIIGYELGARADDLDSGKKVEVPATPATKEQVAAVDAWMLAITKDVPAARALRDKLEVACIGGVI